MAGFPSKYSEHELKEKLPENTREGIEKVNIFPYSDSNIRWFYYLLIDALHTLAWDMLCFVDHLWHRIWAGCFIRTKQEGLWYSSYCKFIPKFFRHYSWNKLDDKTESLCLYFQVRNISIDGKQPTLNAANLVWDLRDVSGPRSKVKPCQATNTLL